MRTPEHNHITAGQESVAATHVARQENRAFLPSVETGVRSKIFVSPFPETPKAMATYLPRGESMVGDYDTPNKIPRVTGLKDRLKRVGVDLFDNIVWSPLKEGLKTAGDAFVLPAKALWKGQTSESEPRSLKTRLLGATGLALSPVIAPLLFVSGVATREVLNIPSTIGDPFRMLFTGQTRPRLLDMSPEAHGK